MPAPPTTPPAPSTQPGTAGLDEAGRGCLAGPVVAAAVVLPPGLAHPLLRDSKQLSPSQRVQARELILAEAEGWGLGILSPAEIDRQNILQAAISAMHQAVDLLPLPPQHLLVDGRYFRPYEGIPHETVVKGDSRWACIAAASILAKTYRDELMAALHSQYPAFGWAGNKGYPTRAHYQALALHGPTPWHRRSFKLTRQGELFAR